MKKYSICYIIVFLLGSFALHSLDKTIYERYCIHGNTGYQKFYKEKSSIPSEALQFWKDFKDLLTHFDDDKSYLKICKCSDFWIRYQQDPFFETKNFESEDFERVKNIFLNAGVNYWQKIDEQMARLEKVDSTPDEVRTYTQNKAYAHKLSRYQALYNQLNPMPLPKSSRTIQALNTLFSKLVDCVGPENLNAQRKQDVKDYLKAWGNYFAIKIPARKGKYLSKATAYKKRKDHLEKKINPLLEPITFMGVNSYSRDIQDEIKKVSGYYALYTGHHNLDTYIDNFSIEKEKKWDQLLAIRNKILKDARNIGKLDPFLETKVNPFREIPNDYDLESLEKYVQAYRKSTHMIVGIVKEKYRQLLLETIEKQWEVGIWKNGTVDTNALIKFSNNIKKYKKDFDDTIYDKYPQFLNQYYTMQKNDNIPGLYRHVKSHPLSKEELNHMQNQWGIQTLEELKKEYSGYINSIVRKLLNPQESRQTTKQDLDRFNQLYRDAMKDLPGFRIESPLWKKYQRLISIYYPQDGTLEKNAVRQPSRQNSRSLDEYGFPIQRKNGTETTYIPGGSASHKITSSQTKQPSKKNEKKNEYSQGSGSTPIRENSQGDGKRDIIIFLKDVKEYLENSGTLEADNKNVKIISQLFDPEEMVAAKKIQTYRKAGKVPNDFNFRIYKFLWYCTQKKKEKILGLLEVISKKDQEIGEALYEFCKYFLE